MNMTKTILVADDKANIRNLVQGYFEAKGIEFGKTRPLQSTASGPKSVK